MGYKLQKSHFWSLTSFVTIFHESVLFPCAEPIASLCGRHKEELLLPTSHNWRALKWTFCIVIEKDKEFLKTRKCIEYFHVHIVYLPP